MHIFDYSYLKDRIPADMAGIANIIYDLRGRNELRCRENEKLFADLRHAAMIDSVRSSNAIEGIVTTRKRIEEIVDDAPPRTHDEHEINGYKNVLNEIYSDEFRAVFDEELIKHFHYQILQDTSREAGEYKKENNWIQERDGKGRLSVRFLPTKAKDTPEAMKQMILAYREANQDSEINQLLLIACVIVDFLCVHPFMDGNGRVSRLLTTMLLQNAGFDIGRYISLEKKIDEYKMGYYDALMHASEGWHENENDYTPFITFLLQILYACYKEMDQKFFDGKLSGIPKSKRVENLLLNMYVPISKQEIAERFPEISVTTIERVLGKMVREGSIEKIGTYRDARYRKI